MKGDQNEYDGVIIGSGVTGLAAAVTLAESDGNVLILEKQNDVGGTSINFRGTFAVESRMQREKFIACSRDQAWRRIMEFSHWLANPLLVRKIVDQSANTISMSEIAYTVVQPDLWVNYHGERFCDECVCFDDTSMGNVSVKQRNGESYSIFDRAAVRRLAGKNALKYIGRA